MRHVRLDDASAIVRVRLPLKVREEAGRACDPSIENRSRSISIPATWSDAADRSSSVKILGLSLCHEPVLFTADTARRASHSEILLEKLTELLVVVEIEPVVLAWDEIAQYTRTTTFTRDEHTSLLPANVFNKNNKRAIYCRSCSGRRNWSTTARSRSCR